jgi:hypothetical protein
MKYIFVTGAPGSKWSSVVKNIYYSPNIDHSDYSGERTYYHDASGEMKLMHLGAYFDPGMEFGNFFDKLNYYSKEDCEKEFDRPFKGEGVKIIKSHVFAHHIDFLLENWSDCPIVLVYRNSDSCLGWWVRCGEFNITYPNYEKYYKNLRYMSKIIDHQNKDIKDAWYKHKGKQATTNCHLCDILKIDNPPEKYYQRYANNDINVVVLNEQLERD